MGGPSPRILAGLDIPAPPYNRSGHQPRRTSEHRSRGWSDGGMSDRRPPSTSLSNADPRWSAFRRMLEPNTCDGSRLVVAPRFYPSTKACSTALVTGGSPETENACGAQGSERENSPVKPAALKQEPPSRNRANPAVGNIMR